MAKQVAIAGTRYPDFSIEETVFESQGVTITSGSGATEEDLVELVNDADAVLVGSLPRFTAAVIDRIDCPAIIRSGIGFDNIDLDAARARGKWVAYVPDYGDRGSRPAHSDAGTGRQSEVGRSSSGHLNA